MIIEHTLIHSVFTRLHEIKSLGLIYRHLIPTEFPLQLLNQNNSQFKKSAHGQSNGLTDFWKTTGVNIEQIALQTV